MASNDITRLTCAGGSVGSTEGNDAKPQRRETWAWKRQEDAVEGTRERTRDAVVVGYIDGKDVDSLRGVFCALEAAGQIEKQSWLRYGKGW